MRNINAASDILDEVKGLVDVIYSAGADLGDGDYRRHAIRTTAHEVSVKLKQAIDLLDTDGKPANSRPGAVAGSTPQNHAQAEESVSRATGKPSAATPVRSLEMDRRHARAHFALESIVNDVRNATLLMEMAAEDTVFSPETEMEMGIRAHHNGMKGFRVMVLTEEQEHGLDYALRHIGDLTRKLHESYYAAFKDEAGQS